MVTDVAASCKPTVQSLNYCIAFLFIQIFLLIYFETVAFQKLKVVHGAEGKFKIRKSYLHEKDNTSCICVIKPITTNLG